MIWQNIGFDIRGDIKIFDFGLAKELKPIECEGKDEYHSSGMAGTRRYMAPEMAQARGYGKLFYISFRIIMRFTTRVNSSHLQSQASVLMSTLLEFCYGKC